jgi:ADP-heptose:LPS heptosyltransferase
VQNLLLVNLMRMGDILQMTPLVQALRESRPEARISMLLNETFVDVAKRIDVDTVLPFPVHSLVETLSGANPVVRGFSRLHELVKSVNGAETYDLVFNLTPSKSAASFCSLLAHEDCRGMWLGDDGSFQAVDPWAAYLVAMMANRRGNPFHLVDIWLRTLGQRGPRRLQMFLSPEDDRRADTLLTDSGVGPDRELLVGFQVSASQKEKCWSEKEFVRLGRSLRQGLNARVLLFGVEGEASLCERVSARIPGSISLAGKTGVGELAAILKRCRVLVTNDTGTQHVAAAVGTPVVVISVGPVFFRETGPYGEGHLVFQPRMPCAPCPFHVSCMKPVCKEKIRAEFIHQALLRLLRGEDGVPEALPQDVLCYRSSFDDDGYLIFQSNDSSLEDRRLRSHKAFWHALLEDRPLHGSQEVLEDFEPDSRRGWNRLEAMLRRSSGLMRRIGEAGNREGPATEQLHILSGNLGTTEQEMRRLALEVDDLAPFVHYLFLRREALSVQDPLAFLQESSSLYLNAAERIRHRFRCDRSRKEAICHG